MVSAGIPRPIAQRPLLLAALALAATLGGAAPASADAPDLVGTVPAQAAQTVSGAVEAVPPTPAQPAVEAVAPAAGALRQAVEAAARPVERVRGGGPLAGNAADPAATGADAVRAIDTAAGEATERGPLAPAAGELRRRAPLGPATGELRPGAALDDALRALGDTLRAVVPLDSLAGPLIGGDGRGRLAASVLGGSPPPALGALTTRLRAPGAGLAVRAPGAPIAAPRPNAHPSFQSASVQPPAAEAGGRPSSPPPRKVPAPAAGGAATPAPGGFLAGSFLALLVLAALAAPRLMRSLDSAAALLRPSPFVCALERPG